MPKTIAISNGAVHYLAMIYAHPGLFESRRECARAAKVVTKLGALTPPLVLVGSNYQMDPEWVATPHPPFELNENGYENARSAIQKTVDGKRWQAVFYAGEVLAAFGQDDED